MAAVQNDDNLKPGTTYTFEFQVQDWFFGPDANGIVGALVSYAPDFITSVTARNVGEPGLFQGVDFGITWTYAGDGSDVAIDVANDMINAIAQSGHTVSLVALGDGAVIPYVPTSSITNPTGGAGGNSPENTGNGFKLDNTTLALIVGGLVLVVFLVSGGPSIVRGLAGK